MIIIRFLRESVNSYGRFHGRVGKMSGRAQLWLLFFSPARIIGEKGTGEENP